MTSRVYHRLMSDVLYPSGYASPGSGVPMQTLAQIQARHDFQMLAPEMQRRISAVIVRGEGRVGYGSGGRTNQEQATGFVARHHKVTCPGHFQTLGACWDQNPGTNSWAPPGCSWHEESPDAGGALAADMIGDLTYMHTYQADYGLHTFESVNNEPWHAQPLEIPNGRTPSTRQGPLPVWVFPGDTPVDPTPVNLPSCGMGDSGSLISVIQAGLRDGASQPIGDPDGDWGAETQAGWDRVVLWVNTLNPGQLDVNGRVDGQPDWDVIAWISKGWQPLYDAGFPH